MSSATNHTRVENVRVKNIRPKGYHDLSKWCEDPDNKYIGRAGVVFVKTSQGKKRYPPRSSIWANPYKLKNYSRKTSLKLYRKHILKQIAKDPKLYDIEQLRGKTLGCWCHPDPCHGDVLCEILANV